MSKAYALRYIQEKGCYVFETEHGLVYEIVLTDRAELIEAYPQINLFVFELGFAPVNSGKTIADTRIEPTIIQFVSDYFAKQTNALVIIYESLDGKQQARSVLFNKWINRNTAEINLEKISFSINMYEDLDMKGLFIFRADHPQYNDILQMVDDIIKDMQSLK